MIKWISCFEITSFLPFLGICLHHLLEKGKSLYSECGLIMSFILFLCPVLFLNIFLQKSDYLNQLTWIVFIVLMWYFIFIFFRQSTRFPQHRRKKRKEMEEGIPETNQHKQSKFDSDFCSLLCASFSFTAVFQLLRSVSIWSALLLDAYIIKLFDRSVDLAQFNTSTPLYPICRAWMKNNPSVRESVASPGSPPGMTEEEVGLSNMSNKGNMNLYLQGKFTNLFVIQHHNIIKSILYLCS